MGLAGTLGDLLGVVFMASLGGALYLAAGVIAWVTLRPGDMAQPSGPARSAKGLPARTEAA